MPQDADPTSILWCRDGGHFEANYQLARCSAAQNKKDYGIDFNPGPAEPSPDGTREAEPNSIGPVDDLAAYLAHCTEQRASVAAAQE